MGKLRNTAFRVGEIIRIESALGLPPAGVYRVDGLNSQFLMLSAGDFSAGVHPKMITVVERGLPEPESWLEVEVELLQEQVKHCDCAECQKLLIAKRAALWSQATESAH
jgi:hypothetical protein